MSPLKTCIIVVIVYKPHPQLSSVILEKKKKTQKSAGRLFADVHNQLDEIYCCVFCSNINKLITSENTF